MGTGHKLDVQHEADSTAPVLVAVLLPDVDTHELLRQELVNLAPGQEVVLLDIPAGAYEVVSLFNDGTRSPAPPEQRLRVYISPDADAAVSFRR